MTMDELESFPYPGGLLPEVRKSYAHDLARSLRPSRVDVLVSVIANMHGVVAWNNVILIVYERDVHLVHLSADRVDHGGYPLL